MEDYLVPRGVGRAEYIEKKSRFLGGVYPVTSEQEAKEILERVRKQHYDARHNCWCYILKSGQKRYSDDGEPQGTAGMPILEMLKKEELYDVLCIVTRYFGGVKLGASGLTRAYGHGAKIALEAAGIAQMQPFRFASVPCPYALLETVRYDISFRQLCVERGNIPEGCLPFLLGRPLSETLVMFGLALTRNNNRMGLVRRGEGRYCGPVFPDGKDLYR